MMRYAVLGAAGSTIEGVNDSVADAGLMVFASTEVEPDERLLRFLGVDLIFVGLSAGDDASLSAVQALSGAHPVVLLEERIDADFGRRAVAGGARASLAVPCAPDDIAAVLHDVAVERHATVAYAPDAGAASPAARAVGGD